MVLAAKEAGATVLDVHVHEFGEGFGNTGVALLAESHISVHTWPENGYAAFDIFMCGDKADLDRAIELITGADEDGKHSVQVLPRGASQTVLTQPALFSSEFISDAPILLAKLEKNLSISSAEALRSVTEVAKFLSLCAASNETLTPSKLVDDVWHEMILFTRSYQSICTRYLGRFVHHQPSNNSEQEENQYLKTLSLYQKYYGTPDSKYWPMPGRSLSCGTCETN